MARYNADFKRHHQLCLSILKRFGFGQRVMETRILMEVEEMINRVREQQGRAFDVKQLTTSCVANVILSMLFGRRFEHYDPAFLRILSCFENLFLIVGTSVVNIFVMFPFIRFIPYVKKKIAEARITVDRLFNVINVNVASCVQVYFA